MAALPIALHSQTFSLIGPRQSPSTGPKTGLKATSIAALATLTSMLEYPLQSLEMAIESHSERRVCEALANRHVRRELRCSTTEHNVPRSPQEKKYNVFTCVESAVRCGMPDVVFAMEEVNPEDVRMATWYTLYKLRTEMQSKSKSKSRSRSRTPTSPVHIPPALASLANEQRRVWLWERVGTLAMARHAASLTRTGLAGAAQGIATVPDALFHLILSFVELPEQKEYQIRRFLLEARPCRTCCRLCIPGNCKAKQLRRMERRAATTINRSAANTRR